MEGLQITIPQRLKMARVSLSLTLLVCHLLTFRLWLNAREFPRLPMFNGFIIDPLLENIIAAAAGLCLLFSFVMRRQRLLLFVYFLIVLVLVGADVNRLQPWLIVFGSMLLVLVFYNDRVDDPNNFTSLFIVLQIVLAGAYLLNALYLFKNGINHEFESVASPLRDSVSERQWSIILRCAPAMPWVLLGIGITLLLPALRYLGIAFGIVLHVLLLILMFPSQQRMNTALWFSSVTFIVMTLLLFSGRTKQRYYSPVFLLRQPLFYLCAAFFMVIPLVQLQTVNGLENYTAFRIKVPAAAVPVKPVEYEGMSLYQKAFCVKNEGGYSLNYSQWFMHESRSVCIKAPYEAAQKEMNLSDISRPLTFLKTSLVAKK
jgi:hypothetical protein